jgi:hypothetical protein
MNALKHGLTAKTVLLAEEDPGEFRQLMLGWFEAKRPQDKCEASLVERGVYALWQLERSERSHAARLWLKAFDHAEDEKTRVGEEVDGLIRRLLRAPQGRPTAYPRATGSEDDAADTSASGATIDEADHPATLIGQIIASELGCRRLLAMWDELRASLDQDGWRSPQRFRAFRLLGFHPSDIYMTTALAATLQACHVLDPDASNLVGEVWNECVSADALREIDADYQRETARLPIPDQDAARQHLREIIEREVALIEEKAQRHSERAAVEEPLLPHLLAVDQSREGKLMQRYEDSCRKFFLRCLDELGAHRAETAELNERGLGGRYHLPSPKWFKELETGRDAHAASAGTQTASVERREEAEGGARSGLQESARVEVEQAAGRREGTAEERMGDDVADAARDASRAGGKVDVELAAERHEGRSAAGASERVGGDSAEAARDAAGRGDSVDVALAAARFVGRSDAGAAEREVGAGLTGAGDGRGEQVLRRELSAPSGTGSLSSNHGCVAMDGSHAVAARRVMQELRPRVVSNGARSAPGHTTNARPVSNRERKRLRREERRRIRELAVVGGTGRSDLRRDGGL